MFSPFVRRVFNRAVVLTPKLHAFGGPLTGRASVRGSRIGVADPGRSPTRPVRAPVTWSEAGVRIRALAGSVGPLIGRPFTAATEGLSRQGNRVGSDGELNVAFADEEYRVCDVALSKNDDLGAELSVGPFRPSFSLPCPRLRRSSQVGALLGALLQIRSWQWFPRRIDHPVSYFDQFQTGNVLL